MAGLSRVIERQDLTARLSTEIARADLKLRPAEFVALWIASPFVFVAASHSSWASSSPASATRWRCRAGVPDRRLSSRASTFATARESA